jgi:hypothetical protein
MHEEKPSVGFCRRGREATPCPEPVAAPDPQRDLNKAVLELK